MMLRYVLAISSEQRLRVLAERSACVIAGADRGQFDICCGTGMYGRSSEKTLFFRESDGITATYIDASGQDETHTIMRAELVAIKVALNT